MGIQKAIRAVKELEGLDEEERKVAMGFFCPVCGRQLEDFDLFPGNVCDDCGPYIRVSLDHPPTAQ